MICRRIDRVGSNDIGPELAQQGNITLAVGLVRQRIDEFATCRFCAIGRGVLLVGNSFEEELSSVFVKELGALEFDHAVSESNPESWTSWT